MATTEKTSTVPSRPQLVTEAQQLGVKGAAGMRKDDLILAIASAKRDAKGVEPKADTKPTRRERVQMTPAERTNKMDRAHDEHMALMAWERDGRKGDRPDTSTYDEMTAPLATGKKRSTKSNGANGTGKVKLADGELDTLVTSFIVGGHKTHGAVLRAIRDSGQSAQDTRVRAAFQRVTTGSHVDPKVRAALNGKAEPEPKAETPKPEPKKATSASYKADLAAAQKSEAAKQTPKKAAAPKAEPKAAPKGVVSATKQVRKTQTAARAQARAAAGK